MLGCSLISDSRWSNALAARLALAVLALCTATRAYAIDITVAANVVGETPEVVGYNAGHFLPGSNTADWWRYSGTNGARIWSTPSVVEANDDNGLWGDGVNSQTSFLNRRAALRNDPLSTTYINWPYFESRFDNSTTSGNNIRLNYAFGQMKVMGAESVAVINATVGGWPFDAAGTSAGWADRWEYWQHFYAQAFHLARHFDVARFHMYNEPDHSSNASVTQAMYLERLQLASDAVQAAVGDVNATYGKSLVAQVQAPVSAGGSGKFTPNPGGDPRDDVTGWGQLVVENRHTNFLGVTDPNFNLIHTYAYQQYNLSGASFGNELATIKSLVATTSGGEDVRFALTEFNVHTAATFDTLTETLDTPSKSSRFGAIFANLANNQPDELYVFKFSQTDNTDDGGVKKNGTHYVDNNGPLHNIGGVTKGGEVVRLFAKSFAGANELFAVPAASGSGASDLRLAASHDALRDGYYFFSANEATAARDLTVNLTQWGIEPGARIVVEEVSANRHGEVSQLLTVPANRILNLSQTAQSVLLLSIPKHAAEHEITLTATDDAMVKAGTNGGANFGTSPNLFAKNEPVNPAARNISFIKFNTGSIVSSEVEQAILQVHGENVGAADQVIAHVYGIADDQWSEATINWNNAPNLADTSGTAVDDISENFIEGIGDSAQLVGHLTGVAASRTLALDVTRFVRDHPNQVVTFLIAREVRFDGENVDDDLTSLRLASKERGTEPGPQLLLSLSGYALTGDYDHNGVVDAADYAVWRQTFGDTINLAADGNRNGAVDAADYTIWRENLGASLPGTSAAASGALAIPEPTAATFGFLSLLLTAWLRTVRSL